MKNFTKNFTKSIGKYIFSGNDPDFKIIGVQKSGTTSLHYYLNQHPNLVGTFPKSIHYFEKKVNFGYNIDFYKNQFNHFCPKNKLFFESTTKYIYNESVAIQLS